MKSRIRKTKDDLVKEIERLKRIVRTLLGFLITIIIIVPWSAILLGTRVNAVFGLVSLFFSIWLIKFLKKKKII